MAYELHHDPRSSHQQIARYVRELGVDPVLDVGASTGQLGRLLRGSGLEIDAIEPDEASAASARPHYARVFMSSVEDVELPPAHYRLVICADILEHTVHPVAVLRHLTAAAAPGARFVISVPNVGHLAARGIILAGRFPQDDRGIFDRTHLHFYTRDTAGQLLVEAGLQIERVDTTPVPLEEAWPRALPSALREAAMRMQRGAARIAPRAFAYQWLIYARCK